jgi:SAM-dependent methyltransferase
MIVSSPISSSNNTKKIFPLENEKIKAAYSSDFKIDVSNYLDNKEISLWECLDSGYRFYYPFDIFGDGKFYSDLQTNSTAYYRQHNYEHTIGINEISSHDKVLEIGCGDGYFLDLCKEKGIDATGLELNEKAVEDCLRKNLKVYNSTIENFTQTGKTFDVVCFFQVLEHITNVRSFLNAAISCLKPNGKLIIAVPNNNPFLFKYDIYHTLNLPPHHAGLWNKEAFFKLQQFFPINLKSVFIEPITEYKSWFIAQKNYYKEKTPLIGALLSLVPRPLYKVILRLFQRFIEGRNIIVVFNKRESA